MILFIMSLGVRGPYWDSSTSPARGYSPCGMKKNEDLDSGTVVENQKRNISHMKMIQILN